MNKLVVFILVLMAAPANCQCRPSSAQTRWGGNMKVVMAEPKPVKSIHGVALGQDRKPLDGVLVEVYNGEKRVAGCITGETGVFALDVPPGHYELRLSKSEGWDVTSMPVRVRESAPYSKKGFEMWLQLGT
jgi:carboxypeptidase family protein